MNDDLVARLELERLGGMPRWKVRPPPTVDPLPVGRARLRELAQALRDHHELDERRSA